MGEKKGVVFVCLGNICRSPIAEAIFASLVKDRGLEDEWFWDSAGTSGWHIDEDADPRTLAVCRKHGIPCDSRGRKFVSEDFEKFHHILCMDNSNVRNALKVAPSQDLAKKAELITGYDNGGPAEIQDPYYVGMTTAPSGTACSG
eukprot:Clim_evm7s4 gene=Clim_evmTU7s4